MLCLDKDSKKAIKTLESISPDDGWVKVKLPNGLIIKIRALENNEEKRC